MFAGSIVALITPMQMNGEIDFASFTQLIEWHIEVGTSAIVVNGTTGESATLTAAEKIELFTVAVATAKRRISIIAGTGTSSTLATIQETRAAASCGVDACLVVTPYYNRPTQNGLYEHYKAVAESTELPIIVYNVPKRTGCDLQPITLASLAHVKNIIGIKEATGEVARVDAIKALSGDRFILLTGEDSNTSEFIRRGGKGVISVTANIVPELVQAMCQAALDGKTSEAEDMQNQLALLNIALFAETNPIPTKWVLSKMGKIPAGLRLPLTELSESLQTMVTTALEKTGIAFAESVSAQKMG